MGKALSILWFVFTIISLVLVGVVIFNLATTHYIDPFLCITMNISILATTVLNFILDVVIERRK